MVFAYKVSRKTKVTHTYEGIILFMIYAFQRPSQLIEKRKDNDFFNIGEI